jgi:TetR/AcrR family transcriptional regulator, tetracycline repressor protein
MTERVLAPSAAGEEHEDHAERGSREPLTRERIVAAALRVMDAEGLEAVSMRRIGRELGVEAMSLYNHVADKDDLLRGVRELVLSEFDAAEPSDDWRADARRAARAWRTVLRSHPNVITLMTGAKEPLMTVPALRPSEVAFEILGRAGLDDLETARAFCAFGGFILGFVLMESGGMMGGGARPTDEMYVVPGLKDELPRTCAVLPYLLVADADEQFDYGIDMLLEGLKARSAP